MPLSVFIVLLATVIAAAAVTIALFLKAGVLGLAVALPLALIAALTLRSVWK
ncbi:MAG: hypothetical protein ABJJ53_05280 [Sulfitobacter sp.]